MVLVKFILALCICLLTVVSLIVSGLTINKPKVPMTLRSYLLIAAFSAIDVALLGSAYLW